MGGRTLEGEVLERSGRRCCICFGLHGDFDIKRGQIAHLDHNHQNNDIDNLAFLCLIHHDEYDTRTSQSKGWTIEEAKHYRALLYDEIERLRNALKHRRITTELQFEPPILSQILSHSPVVMDAIDKDTGQKHLGITACPLDGAGFTFDVTNPNQFDLRITRLYVDVTKFTNVDVLGLWEGGFGGGMSYRVFESEVNPKVGTYECVQTSKDFDYLKLAFGEMEAFYISIKPIAEGIYHFRVGIEYSINGKTRKVEADEHELMIGIYDPVFHQPSFDLGERSVEPEHQ